MGFAYIHLALINERGPTDKQTNDFLEFVRDSSHWPLIFHCRTGIGRTTLYRLIEEGHLIRARIGRRAFVTGESIANYINSLTQED